uniref:Coadhesin-like isoform X1 n=1 Tax=Actinia tenebrosa TaxID=6105 RepID=A0A6P8J241_ACTTE
MTLTRVLQILVLSSLIFGCFSNSHNIRDEFSRKFRRAAPSADAAGKDPCKNPMDLLFVLDSSESVGAANWEKILNFTKKVASKFDVKYTRFGVIQYHSIPEVPIVLRSFHDNTTLDDAIGSIYYKPGSTRTDLAITKAAEVFNTSPLRKASRVAIFVIGGRSTDLFVSKGQSINATDLIKEPSAALHAAHVAVYAVSVSEGLPAAESTAFKAELNILTSNPPLDHIFESTTFDDLLSTKPAEVAKKTCIVNGGMSAWSAWSTCSVTCGTGTRVRMRTCNNPKPNNGGLPCTESTVETGECSVQPCPGHGSSNPGITTAPSASSSSNSTLPSSSLMPNATNPSSSGNSSALFPKNPNANSTNPQLTNGSSTPSSQNVTLPPEPSTPNATMTQIPLPSNYTPSTPDVNNTSPMLPKYNLTSLISNKTRPSTNNPAVPKPEAESPWPATSSSCKPNQPASYGYPDLRTCGNGFEPISLSPHQLSASSTYSKDTGDKIIQFRHAPYNGILNNTQNAGAWCAEHQFAVSQDANQYFSIDLGTPTLIGKVATQGMEHWDNWVYTYALKYSIDNINWKNYPRTLQGNCDRRSITENILNPPVLARFLHVNPTSWYTSFDPAKHDICMRVGVYKCRDCKLVPVSRCNINDLGKTTKTNTKE